MIHFLTFHYHFLPKYLLPDTQPAHLFLNHLHCKWNNSGFLAGITKWFYHTMLHTHGYNWWKFEDLTPTSLDSTEHQNVCNLMWKVLYFRHGTLENNVFPKSLTSFDLGKLDLQARYDSYSPRTLFFSDRDAGQHPRNMLRRWTHVRRRKRGRDGTWVTEKSHPFLLLARETSSNHVFSGYLPPSST